MTRADRHGEANVDTNLANVEPEVLNAALTRLFTQHGHAIDDGDKQAAAEIHWGIVAIQDEMARRTGDWIAGKAAG